MLTDKQVDDVYYASERFGRDELSLEAFDRVLDKAPEVTALELQKANEAFILVPSAKNFRTTVAYMTVWQHQVIG